MSGLLVTTPTWDEVNDFEQQEVTHLQMTSDAAWIPNDPKCNQQEAALRSAVLNPCTVPARHLHSTQVRGQFPGAAFNSVHDVTDETSDCIPRSFCVLLCF